MFECGDYEAVQLVNKIITGFNACFYVTYGYFFIAGYDIFQRDALNNISTEPQMDSSRVLTTTLRQGCFYLLVFIPITCALLQLFTWSHFTLHGKRLITVKTYRQAQNGVPPDVKTIWRTTEETLPIFAFSSLARTWPLTSLLVYSAQRSHTYHLRYGGAAFAVLYLKMLVLWLAWAVTDLEQAWTCDSQETSVFKLKSGKGSFTFLSIQVSFYIVNIFFF